MAKDSGFNLVEMLNRRSKEQLKGEGEEEERPTIKSQVDN